MGRQTHGSNSGATAEGVQSTCIDQGCRDDFYKRRDSEGSSEKDNSAES